MEQLLLKTHRFLSQQIYHHYSFAPFVVSSLKSPNFRPKSKLRFYRGFTCRFMASSPTATMAIEVKEKKIDLNEKEEKIFKRLLQVVEHFKLETQLRVAGGWVRDKLLGKECHDIDIALDNMLGREFCEKIEDYFSHMGEEKRGRIHVIQCNPDQSKHLETARMHLFDVEIDFVNLRSEDYSENSRIPTMKFGTAEEDAYRRDLTINSLFYNINTNLIEDFTRRGLNDLMSGKIVTPLPPNETFLDDPLRVLRAIRFGARFGFVLDEKLKEAAASDKVKAAIGDKISRERIGHEINLMISGNHPDKAMSYICDLELFWVVFNLPPNTEPLMSEGVDRLCIAYMDAACNLLDLDGCLTFNDDQKRVLLYNTLFLPLRKFVYKEKKAKKTPLVNHIFRNSLKLKASDAETVMNLHSAAEKFVSQIMTSDDVVEIIDHLDRVLAGLLLREIEGYWRIALLSSTLIYHAKMDETIDFLDKHVELDKCIDLYRKVEKKIVELGLDNVWEMKPLMNGKDIMEILQISGGPRVKEVQDKLMKWQLAHPSATAEDCRDWIKESVSKRARNE